MRLRGADVVIPMAHRVSRVQQSRHLVVLAQRPQPLVVLDTAGRRQQGRGDQRDVGLAGGMNRVDSAGEFEDGDGLSSRSRKPPQRRRRFVAVVGSGDVARGDEEQVTSCGEHRGRLPLAAAGEASRGSLPRDVEFPHGGHVLGALGVELTDRRDRTGAVGRYRQSRGSGQRQVVVEVSEGFRDNGIRHGAPDDFSHATTRSRYGAMPL